MIEGGVEQFKSTHDFKPAHFVTNDVKPLLIFQGEPFDNIDKHKRFKNLLIDFFRLSDLEEADIT